MYCTTAVHVLHYIAPTWPGVHCWYSDKHLDDNLLFCSPQQSMVVSFACLLSLYLPGPVYVVSTMCCVIGQGHLNLLWQHVCVYPATARQCKSIIPSSDSRQVYLALYNNTEYWLRKQKQAAGPPSVPARPFSRDNCDDDGTRTTWLARDCHEVTTRWRHQETKYDYCWCRLHGGDDRIVANLYVMYWTLVIVLHRYTGTGTIW